MPYMATTALAELWAKCKAAFAPLTHTHSGYQATLVSGTNIKTINNQSLLGSGNIAISGGGETYSDFTGATSTVDGAHGLVPAPVAGDNDFGAVLTADGYWTAPLDAVSAELADAESGAGFLAYSGSSIETRALAAGDIPNIAASKITSGVLDPARALGWLTNNASSLSDTVIPISSSRYTSGGNTGWSVVNLRGNLQLCFGTTTANVVVNTAHHNMYRNSADLYLRLPAFGGEPTRILAALSTIQGGSAGMDAFMQFGGTRPGNWYPSVDHLTNYDIPFRIVASHAYGSSNVRFYFSVLLLVYTT